jgi:hypothetical protein
MKLIATQTLASAQPTITFNDIPQNFTDLVLLISSRIDRSDNWYDCIFRFNNISTGYSQRILYGNGSNAFSITETELTVRTSTNGNTANTFGNARVYISNYTAAVAKSISMDVVSENNATTAFQGIQASLWNNTAPITSIALSPITSNNFVAGTTISLYGIGGAGNGWAPKATGGVISKIDGYYIHTFTASGTFTPTANLTDVEYLVIAGGGGAGGDAGGGGGAGGYRSSVVGQSSGGGASAESRLSLTSGTPITVTVGAGGAGGLSGNAGSNGVASVFGSISTVAGGGGGRGTGDPAKAGGSGGAGSNRGVPSTTVFGAIGTANQGFAGGSALSNGSGQQTGGGGGGAGAIGGDSLVGVAGNGGVGVSSSITGTNVFRAGGGGGGSLFQTTHGTGGLGGGGNGPGGPGTFATGGGGAGNTDLGNGGAGGSGIVIVRYAA